MPIPYLVPRGIAISVAIIFSNSAQSWAGTLLSELPGIQLESQISGIYY